MELLPQSSDASVADLYSQIKDLHEKRLWHNLTVKLVQLIELPQLKENTQLIELYKFIQSFENKLNQLTLAKIVVVISKAYTDPGDAINFLQTLADKLSGVEGTVEPILLLESVIAQLKLKQGKQEESKALLEKIQNTLDGITGVDSAIYSNYYRAQAEYWKLREVHAEYYKYALLFLSYTSLETMDQREKIEFGYDLAIAALIGEETYNFGDLLAHSILESLKGTQQEWISHLLHAFNSGNIPKYEQLVSECHVQMNSVPALLAKTELLKEKISILCLMELVFNRHSVDRHIPFSEILEKTNLPHGTDLEQLVMKALSLKLIKGYIDEVDQRVVVTWVQPRVLGIEQIARMRDRFEEWVKEVNSTLVFMEQGTPDLFS